MTSAETEGPDLALRPASSEDADKVAEVYLAARAAAPMPPPIHSETAIRSWVSGRLREDSAWVAERAGRILAYARFTDAWLDDLYVHPEHAGQGLGSVLLDVVKARRPDGFCLWVFESNTPAREFYRRRGLVTLERTDGSGNEEREPDLRMAWPGTAPLAFYRGLIDEVDSALGQLLARRVALTRAVQEHKAGRSGPVERDPEREAEIVAALAHRAPELGPERWGRIIHTIITESVDAAQDPRP